MSAAVSEDTFILANGFVTSLPPLEGFLLQRSVSVSQESIVYSESSRGRANKNLPHDLPGKSCGRKEFATYSDSEVIALYSRNVNIIGARIPRRRTYRHDRMTMEHAGSQRKPGSSQRLVEDRSAQAQASDRSRAVLQSQHQCLVEQCRFPMGYQRGHSQGRQRCYCNRLRSGQNPDGYRR